ncbi:MAG: NAD(P)/FAD-dependent oxidoreductase [Chlamydiales bacterium]
MKVYDAIVIGSGPNGLSAAIMFALNGLSVLVLEEKEKIGGGARTEELTLPGFHHDVCSTIHPLGIGSPFFKKLPLSDYGLEWIHPIVPLAHPYDDGSCFVMEQSLDKTLESLGIDGKAYRDLFAPFVNNWPLLEETILGPITFPKHPIIASKFALKGIQSAYSLVNKYFRDEKTRGYFAGLAAHSILPLNQRMTAAIGLVLGILGHVYGWPMPKGGSQRITKALSDYLINLGGEITTGFRVDSLKDIPDAKTILFDLTPKQVVKIAGDHLSEHYVGKLNRFRYGPGVFKIDWALDAPIPWKARECLKAGTVHVGGTFNEIAESEAAVWKGKQIKKPFILVAQNSLFDETRAPKGKHTAWAYCHVPNGSQEDMTREIELQISRFAPHFQRHILARSTKNTLEMHHYNSNYIGGDITGGVQDFWQTIFRPTSIFEPYATSNPKIYICSSSTPPGAGVHGMCGYHAAKLALKKVFGINHKWDRS